MTLKTYKCTDLSNSNSGIEFSDYIKASSPTNAAIKYIKEDIEKGDLNINSGETINVFVEEKKGTVFFSKGIFGVSAEFIYKVVFVNKSA